MKYYLKMLLVLLLISSCQKEETIDSGSNYNQSNSTSYSIDHLGLSANKLETHIKTDNARAIHLVGDDTLLLVHSRNTESVETYVLKTAGAIQTGEWVSSFSTVDYIGTTSQGSNGHGIFIKPESLDRVWLFNRTEIWQFDLLTPGDMTSASNTGYKDLSEIVERGHDLFFAPNGEYIYIDDRNAAAVHQFLLNDNWDINTMEIYYSLDISNRHEAVRSVTFDAEGIQFFLLDTGMKELQAYTLTTPWSLNSATFKSAKTVEHDNPRGFSWNSSGTKAYIMNTSTGTIYQYDTQD